MRLVRADVVFAFAVGQVVVELAGLGVHEIGGELAGVPAEQGVGQRDVSPEEAEEVQPHHEHGQRVDEAPYRRRALVLAEERPVGKRIGEVLGHEGGVEGLAA